MCHRWHHYVSDSVNASQNSHLTGFEVSQREHTTTTIVFFLGGCTYTEIAALRWVGRQNRGEWHVLAPHRRWLKPLGRRFLIATTGMVSGTSLIDSIGRMKRSDREKEAGLS